MVENFSLSLPEMWSTIESRKFEILADLNRNLPKSPSTLNGLHFGREQRRAWNTTDWSRNARDHGICAGIYIERDREVWDGRQFRQHFSKIAGTFNYSQSTNEHKRCILSCFNPFIASNPKVVSVVFVKYGSIAIHTIYTFTSFLDFNPIHRCPLHWNVEDKRVLVHPSRLKKPAKLLK